MVKLTKAQRKQRDRIDAWIKQEPFKENARDKHPKVPEFTPMQLIDPENGYVPLNISDGGKFYTPLDMGEYFWNYVLSTCPMPERVLDPCAGIGNLVVWPYQYTERIDQGIHRIDALELDQEAVEIGAKLFPTARWFNVSAYEHWNELQGKYDMVLMNPPFNITWATAGGDEMVRGRCKKSEHMFFELALRAVMPGGTIGIIAPYNYMDRMPKAMKEWRGQWMDGYDDLGVLPGKFKFTGVSVHGWIIHRNDEEMPQEIGEATLRKYIVNNQTLDAQPTPGEIIAEIEANSEKIQESIVDISNTLTKMSFDDNVDDDTHNVGIVVPQKVFEGLVLAQQSDAPMQSIKQLTVWLRSNGKHDASNWVKANPIDYGIGYWGQFLSETMDILIPTA